MTKEETKKILMIIDSAYPNFKAERPQEMVETWSFLLADYSYRDIALALKSFIVTENKGFPPSVGEIIAQLYKPAELTEMTEQQAWGIVRKAVGRATYYAEEEFEKLPKVIQDTVGSPAQLRNWAMTDLDTVETVVASNFQRSYRAKVKNEKEMAKIPKSLLGLVNKTIDVMGIEDKSAK